MTQGMYSTSGLLKRKGDFRPPPDQPELRSWVDHGEGLVNLKRQKAEPSGGGENVKHWGASESRLEQNQQGYQVRFAGW